MSKQNSAGIPLRALGRTGIEVTAIGFGGYHLGEVKDDGEAVRLVHRAIDAGITFMDNAWEYHDGRSEELMGRAIADRRDEVFLMSKVCTHGRDRHEAMRQLEDSLRRLQTDYLDLWQVHEVVYENDPELHFAPGGVIEALEQARQEGKVRYIGFTGHKSAEIHLKMLAYEYPFDACQLPLNALDGTFRSFEQKVLPELERQGIAAIGMKSMGGGGDMVKAGVLTAEEALRYVMSLPVATVVSGIESAEILQQNLAVARDFQPMTAEQMQSLRMRCAAAAGDGRYELYKVSAKHEGPIGRAQHGFPPFKAMRA
ncbi:MAG TPA: aldo/keto reductase [Blastocatellia bacterium]|nr:aldo/keto reductase [Blastocatellia bacterium]HMV81587.1 aldo/keto reductase [Blastocatellia bacterium]HMX24377.1 aldo/keto reductase [Blastocatellia bacterium]HMY71939.1 aldo/keto reductase [Blastocatellia bacterium]HMZ21821.1 aldo/keto reductase [Blastocatellia bacterium]